MILTKEEPIFVAFEGLDACGKSLQAKVLSIILDAATFKSPDLALLTGVPINTLLHSPATSANTILLQSLMVVNRLEAASGGLNEALEEGNSVVYDRYVASGLAYGAAGCGLHEWLRGINGATPMPDLQILLDIPVEVSLSRRPDRRDALEADRAYLERVRSEYTRLWENPPSWPSWRGSETHWVKIDGTLPPWKVAIEILKAIGRFREEMV